MNPLSYILLYCLGIVLLMYFLIVIPGKKKNKRIREMHDAVKVGNEIVTIGGIIGEVLQRNGDELLIQIDSKGATMRVLIFAVQSILSSEETPAYKNNPDSKSA